MARMKKIKNHKEPVRMRFKELSDGSQSIYLDIYRKGKRSYEFLKMYLIPETSANAKARNEATLRAADAIKSQRIIEMTNSEAGLKSTSVRCKILLLDWMGTYKSEQQKKGRKDGKQIDKTVHILKLYNPNARMNDVDKNFILGFIDYMRNTYKTRDGKNLAPLSCINYLACLRNALNTAVRMDMIADNPINKLTPADKIRMPESKREYLTIDEIKRLAETPCRREDIKGAFMFSCYCGLRISDVCGLKWKDLTNDNGQWRVCIVMQKTSEPLYLPLSNQVMKWMPERGDAKDGDRIFSSIPAEINTAKDITPWVKAAGISKHVTFHTSRHSYATMLLTLGADLYTVSKLLGHSKIETTQIYAKIIDQKKNDAINLIDREFAK